MPNSQSTVGSNAETVGRAIGRMAIGLGIGTAGVGMGIGLAVGLYYVGRGLERGGSIHHQVQNQNLDPAPPAPAKPAST